MRCSAPGRPSGSRPVLALSSWNVRELLARHTSSVVAWFQGLDGRQITAYVSPEAAQQLYQGGITFYIRQVPALAPLAEAIATALTVPTQHIACTLFCNQPGARTRMHFDPIDTITMQVTGRKRWRLAPNLHVPHPTVSYATLDPSSCQTCGSMRTTASPPACPPMRTSTCSRRGLCCTSLAASGTRRSQTRVDLVTRPPYPRTVGRRRVGDVTSEAAARPSMACRGPRPVGRQPPVAAATTDRLLDALAAAVDGLTADDVLATPAPRPRGVQPDTPFVRCARAGFSTDTSADERSCCLVTFSVSAYGTERRTTLEMSPLYLDACRCFVTPRRAAACQPVTWRRWCPVLRWTRACNSSRCSSTRVSSGQPWRSTPGKGRSGRGVHAGLRRQARHGDEPCGSDAGAAALRLFGVGRR